MAYTFEPKPTRRPPARCSECDREETHFNEILTPDGGKRTVCWRCLAREEKGFNAAPGFHRQSRRGVIPR